MKVVYLLILLTLACAKKDADRDVECTESIARFAWDFGAGYVKSEAYACVQANGIECAYIRQINGTAFETDCDGDVILR